MKNKKRILVIAVNALLLILIGVCLFRIHSYSTALLSQQASEYWQGNSEERFAQLSCFFPANKLSNIDAINSFRKTIDRKLADAGLKPKEKDDTGEYWTDCYSVTDSLTVAGDRNSAEATVVGVGGDFFLFHPYELVSGSFISEDDVMQDRVVLDYELAWKLFGGEQLAGMTVTINSKPYYVAGVVRRETDKFSKKAFSGEPVMFMSYSTLSSLKGGTGTEGGTASDAGIGCYEIVMPSPITKFAKLFVTESFKNAEGVVVENSSRYEFSSVLKMFEDFGSRSISDSGVIYPYWENAARISEVYVARLYVFILLLLLFPLLCLIVLAARLIKLLVAKLKRIKFQLWDAWDDRYARQEAWKEQRARKRESKKPQGLSERISHFKKHRTKKRIARNLRVHERNREKSLAKKLLPRGQKNGLPELAPPVEQKEQSEITLGEEVEQDAERIVREIMEELNNSKT